MQGSHSPPLSSSADTHACIEQHYTKIAPRHPEHYDTLIMILDDFVQDKAKNFGKY